MVTIIIVVYKSNKKKLLKVLKKIDNKFNIIIVDNSYNYDFSKIKLSKKTQIIRSKNIGNGGGINLALKKCKTKFAIYTDIDVNFAKNTFGNLIKYTRRLRKFSVLVPNHGNLNSKDQYIKKFYGEASMMLFNVKIIKQLNFFDEKIFLYFEEVDLFKRSEKRNINVYFLPLIKIKHERAKSIDSFSLENFRAWHYMWSMFYFYKKNFSFFYAIKKTLLFFVKDIVVLFYSIIIFNKLDIQKRFFRVFGLLCAMFGISSFLRP